MPSSACRSSSSNGATRRRPSSAARPSPSTKATGSARSPVAASKIALAASRKSAFCSSGSSSMYGLLSSRLHHVVGRELLSSHGHGAGPLKQVGHGNRVERENAIQLGARDHLFPPSGPQLGGAREVGRETGVLEVGAEQLVVDRELAVGQGQDRGLAAWGTGWPCPAWSGRACRPRRGPEPRIPGGRRSRGSPHCSGRPGDSRAARRPPPCPEAPSPPSRRSGEPGRPGPPRRRTRRSVPSPGRRNPSCRGPRRRPQPTGRRLGRPGPARQTCSRTSRSTRPLALRLASRSAASLRGCAPSRATVSREVLRARTPTASSPTRGACDMRLHQTPSVRSAASPDAVWKSSRASSRAWTSSDSNAA